MIHSARPIVTPVANIVSCCFVFLDLKSVDGRTCEITMIPTGRDFGLAEWIDKRGDINYPLGKTQCPGSSDHYSNLKVVLFCEILKSGDVRLGKIVITTACDYGSASWINFASLAGNMHSIQKSTFI